MASFVRSSPLKVYQMRTHSGVWRRVVVRTSVATGELMVMVIAQNSGMCMRFVGWSGHGRGVHALVVCCRH